MELREINISNFKMIEQMNISFQPGFNLLLGDNGAGKTTMLEAITVALGGFLTGMEDVATRNILKRDIRYHIERDVNGVPNKVYYPPVEVYGKVLFDGMEYEWTRSKRGDKNEKTIMSNREICKAVQKMVNTVEQDMAWPIICYETASRGWKSIRSDAGKKLRKQINDRRCGYLGCLGEVTNMNAIKEWCYQMEWVLVRTHKQPENYVGFNAIISKFMGYMNDGLKCEVVFNPIEKELMYVENGAYMHISDLR